MLRVASADLTDLISYLEPRPSSGVQPRTKPLGAYLRQKVWLWIFSRKIRGN